MSFESIMKNREARSKSPEFISKIEREKGEFKEILGKLNDNTLEAGYRILLKTPTKIIINFLRAVYADKYGLKDFNDDLFRLFFDKEGVAHNVSRVAGSAVRLASKGAKISIRKLFAV